MNYNCISVFYKLLFPILVLQLKIPPFYTAALTASSGAVNACEAWSAIDIMTKTPTEKTHNYIDCEMARDCFETVV